MNLETIMTKKSNSVKVGYSAIRQVVSITMLTILFALIFQDILITLIATIGVFYFIATFYIITFEINQEHIVIKYPYRFLFRRKILNFNHLEEIKLYKRTGGMFNSPSIIFKFKNSNKSLTVSFLMPSKDRFEILFNSLKQKNNVLFKYSG